MINVTRTFLPPFEEYANILKRAWDKAWITNNGELVQELEARLREYLGAPHLFYTTNGTIVLQMALKALGITGEVITTPFSYVATTNAILWEQAKPVFADIEPRFFCIDPDDIERKITPQTQAILATHVYGYPCQVERIQELADAHGLRVIYDGAHAFGTLYKGKPLLSYGDISTCSFHATKLFHTVEGGAIICRDEELARKLMLYRQFGHVYDDYFSVGINAKNSEFHAAMGLALFPYLNSILDQRKVVVTAYQVQLSGLSALRLPVTIDPDFSWNYAYFPVVFESENQLLRVMKALQEKEVYTRRYFYPSLNTLPFLSEPATCPVSEDIARRVLCLPLYPGLTMEQTGLVCQTITNYL